MIPITIEYKSKKKRTVYFPTFAEMTVRQYLIVTTSTNDNEAFKNITGVDADIELTPLLPIISNLDNAKVPSHIYIGRKKIKIAQDIGKLSFDQKLNAQKKLSEIQKEVNKNRYLFMPDLLSIYLEVPKKTIEKCNFNYLLPVFEHYFLLLLKIIERDVATLNSKHTADEIAAGVKRLSKFGEFSSIDYLAGGDPLKYDDILKLPYDVVYYKLLYRKEMNDYEKRLSEILKNKK